jgi:hypothetical protein
MNSLAYLVALAVGAGLLIWYVVNEARGADGEAGPLGVEPSTRPDSASRPARYRFRERLTPSGRGSVRGASARKSYRLKPTARTFRSADEDAGDA